MNHAYVILKGNSNINAIYKRVSSIVEKYCSQYGIKCFLEDQEIIVGYSRDKNKELILSVWLKSKRTVEMRKGGYKNLYMWVQYLVQTELAKAFKGKLGDESIQERWEPDNKSLSYDEYVNKYCCWI